MGWRVGEIYLSEERRIEGGRRERREENALCREEERLKGERRRQRDLS